MKFKVGDKVIIKDSSLPSINDTAATIIRINPGTSYTYECRLYRNVQISFRDEQLITAEDPNELLKEIL